jgi:hypothetical protein
MPRALALFLLLLLPAAAMAAPARADDGAPAKARTTECTSALQQDERTATFSADMRTVKGAVRLQVRFVLQARTEEEPEWTAVAAPGFGGWNSSTPGIGRYVYTKTVENLLAPADYRAQVHFRWLSAAGKTILRARRTSRVCRQPDLRPDLVPEELVRTYDGYALTVANAGRGDAQSFIVTIEVQGAVHVLGYVETLRGREFVDVRGRAPACAPGEMVIVRVDADGAVVEAEEGLNEMAVLCP